MKGFDPQYYITPGRWKWRRFRPDKNCDWRCVLETLIGVEKVPWGDPIIIEQRADHASFPNAGETANERLLAAAPEMWRLLIRVAESAPAGQIKYDAQDLLKRISILEIKAA